MADCSAPEQQHRQQGDGQRPAQADADACSAIRERLAGIAERSASYRTLLRRSASARIERMASPAGAAVAVVGAAFQDRLQRACGRG